ncbi:MAG: hypothetical protein R3315_05275 [Woeseiaceae bacterium]|nr:hypothetical protein [Woeseiaceae bacterium]
MPERIRQLLAAAALAGSITAAHAIEYRDPMRPEYPQRIAAKAEEDFRLSAVFVSDRQRVAVLNGRLVREGQRVGRARVVAIGADRVTLSVDGVDHVAHLNKSGSRP